MQGRRISAEEQVVTIDLQAAIPPNHLVRRVAKVADLSCIYELTYDPYGEDNGRPSVEPVLFFRMQLIGYLLGISSDRRLCEEVRLNLAYRWFCQLRFTAEVPDHSSFTRSRDRFGVERYQAIFARLLQQLRAQGIVRGRRVRVAATLGEANVRSTARRNARRVTCRHGRSNCTSNATMILRRARRRVRFRTKPR
jgi:transposase